MRACDIADALVADPPSALDDWPWARQLRFYAQPPGDGKQGGGAPGLGPTAVAARMAEAAFGYGWEYQGAAPRLVYTPLTDKAYLTLTQARRFLVSISGLVSLGRLYLRLCSTASLLIAVRARLQPSWSQQL